MILDSWLIAYCKLPPTLARQIWRHNYVIGRSEYLISTLSETTFPQVYSLQFLFKSTYHSWRYEKKYEWVFFSEHSVLSVVELRGGPRGPGPPERPNGPLKTRGSRGWYKGASKRPPWNHLSNSIFNNATYQFHSKHRWCCTVPCYMIDKPCSIFTRYSICYSADMLSPVRLSVCQMGVS